MHLKKAMTRSVVSAGVLARESGVSESTIRTVRKGRHRPREQTMRRLLLALNRLRKENGEAPLSAEEVFGSWVK